MAEKFSHAGHSLRGSQAYQKAKDRAKARSAAITLAGQDIAPLPKVADAARRARGDRDLKFFCETYFPHLFTLVWSQDHLRVIATFRHKAPAKLAHRRGRSAGFSSYLAKWYITRGSRLAGDCDSEQDWDVSVSYRRLETQPAPMFH